MWVEMHRHLPRRLMPIVGSVVALTLAAVFVVFIWPTGVQERPQAAGDNASELGAVGQSLPTSFGVVAVETVEKITPLSPERLAGSSRGGQNRAAPDDVQVQVSATITNLSDREVAYAADQFRLLIRNSGKAVKAARSSLHAGVLQPQASIDEQMDFLVPADASQLWVEFVDSGTTKPVLIDLGHIDRAPSGDPRSPPSA